MHTPLSSENESNSLKNYFFFPETYFAINRTTILSTSSKEVSKNTDTKSIIFTF